MLAAHSHRVPLVLLIPIFALITLACLEAAGMRLIAPANASGSSTVRITARVSAVLTVTSLCRKPGRQPSPYRCQVWYYSTSSDSQKVTIIRPGGRPGSVHGSARRGANHRMSFSVRPADIAATLVTVHDI